MDDLKSKLQKLSIKNPFKKDSKFKGTGHVLGSAAPVAPPRSTTSSGSSSSSAARPNHPAARPPQQVQRAPLTAPAAAQGYAHAAPSFPQNAAAGSPAKPQPGPGTNGPPAPAAAAAVPAHGGSLPLQFASAGGASAGLPSAHGREALETSVAQLASDLHGAAAADLLLRLLRNVLSSPDDQKFRRLRLSNPRIQSAVVEAEGGVELLMACGFQIVFEEPEGGSAEGQTEGYAVLESAADLHTLQHAVLLLQPLASTQSSLPPPQQQQPLFGGRAMPATPLELPASDTGTAVEPAQQLGTASNAEVVPSQQPQQQKQGRAWDPPRPRATVVLLPRSPATDLPEWFFSRTGAELKAAFLSAVGRREKDQMLMTRAMRERLMGGPTQAAVNHALIKVRLPEGIHLQGEFNPGEPVAAVFHWVTESLRDPGCTYELVLPSRKPLVTQGQAVREEKELMPAVTLNFRWTGQSAADMQTTPALREDLLRAAQAPEQG